MKKHPLVLWWRRGRHTDHPIWHFMTNCTSLGFGKLGLIMVSKRPRSGTLCDHCQRLARKIDRKL